MDKKEMGNIPIPRRNSSEKRRKKNYITPKKIIEENEKKSSTLRENFSKLDSFNTSEIDVNQINEKNNNNTYITNGEGFMANDKNKKTDNSIKKVEEHKKADMPSKAENTASYKVNAPKKEEENKKINVSNTSKVSQPVIVNRAVTKNSPIINKETSNRKKQNIPQPQKQKSARGKSKTQNATILVLLILILILIIGAVFLFLNKNKDTTKEKPESKTEIGSLTKDFTIGKGSKMNFTNALYSSINADFSHDLKSFMAENINGDNFLKAMIYESEIDGNALKPNLPARITAAKSFNENVKGWLRLKDSNVNIAIVHNAEKSNAYYTWLGYNEEYSKHSYGSARYLKDYGVAWAAQTSNIDGSRESLSNNTVIFGHNWENISSQPRVNDPKDIMFEQLAAYIYTDFAQTNPYLNFSTETENMMWVVVSAFYTEDYWFAYDKECANLGGIDPGGFNYIDSNFNNAQAEKFVKEIKARSQFNIEGVDITTENKFLTLSTCTRAQGRSANQRFAVIAMLVDENNLPESLVYSANENQKKPAV